MSEQPIRPGATALASDDEIYLHRSELPRSIEPTQPRESGREEIDRELQYDIGVTSRNLAVIRAHEQQINWSLEDVA